MVTDHRVKNQCSPRVLGVDTAYRIHIKLGAGLLESAYEVILNDEGFRADIIVEDRVIIELWRKPCLPAKSIEEVSKTHKKNY